MGRIAEIKRAVVDVIREARGLPILTGSDVKIKSIEKTEKGYKTTGSYECRSLLGYRVEKGSFEVTLDDKLELVESRIEAEG
jgi:uncharacterized protein YodC (DUF2158 family)